MNFNLNINRNTGRKNKDESDNGKGEDNESEIMGVRWGSRLGFEEGAEGVGAGGVFEFA